MTEQWNLQEIAARVEAAQERAQHADGIDALIKYTDVIDVQAEFITALLKTIDIHVQREGQFNQRIDTQREEITTLEAKVKSLCESLDFEGVMPGDCL